MRISDWSSDVCSSDLLCGADRDGRGGIETIGQVGRTELTHRVVLARVGVVTGDVLRAATLERGDVHRCPLGVRGRCRKEPKILLRPDRTLDRKRVVSGQSGSIRVDLGGLGFMTKKK